MAAYIYNITIKTNTPLEEYDIEEALGSIPELDDTPMKFSILNFDLEDDEFSQV